MTETTYKTKEQNTFRFKSFGDRVNEIDLRRLALYHIGHQNETLSENENETHFHQTVKKWMVLNLTEEFNVFSRQFQRVVTLPQLIHQKDIVIDALLDRLATATSLSLQPLLEILYVLARDLREEFYPYFQRVLDRLICLICHTEDAEQLEWTFVCLAYMFKALKPYLKRNIGIVFNSILSLLDEQRYPEYITNFAVECFSFIARDVKDYKKFLDFVLETIAREHVQSVHGCGRLLFEIMRGIKGQFHSTAGEFLHFILNCLITDEEKRNFEQTELLGAIVEHAVKELFKFIYTQNIGLFWQKFCQVAETINDTKKILLLTPIFLHGVSYKNGKHLMEMDKIVPITLKLIEKCIQTKEYEVLRQLSHIISKIVLSSTTQLTQLDTSRLIKKMLTVIEQRDIYDEFVLSIVSHPQFEFLLLPNVIYYWEVNFDQQSLELIANIILYKQPLQRNAIEMPNWKQYPLHLKQQTTLTRIHKKIQDFDYLKRSTNEQLEEFMLFCIIAPHIKSLDRMQIEKKLKETTMIVLEHIDDNSNVETEKQLDIFSLLLETICHLQYKLSKEFLQKSISTLLPHLNRIVALNSLDIILDLSGNHQRSIEEKEPILNALTSFLSQNQHELRLIAIHCLQCLHKTDAKTPYSTLFSTELIKSDLHNYRQQLLHLQKLQTTSELFKSFTQPYYKNDVLHFLLGMLYQNFQFIWEPTLELIEEYSNVMPLEDFWSIYKLQMEKTTQAINECKDKNELMKKIENPNEMWSSRALRGAFSIENVEILSQQDLFKYRNLLWQRLPKFGALIEIKNRELVTFFLSFIENEYRPMIEKRENFLNLLESKTIEQNVQAIEIEIDTDDDDDNDEDEDGDEIKSKTIKRQKARSKTNSIVKSLQQTLQTKMNILIVQPNPKALYREQELYGFYLELLSGSNPFLQKIALDCIMSYKSKDLLPFKDHLYALIDEQKFKTELIQFQLENIIPEQRSKLMVILLRLLYGKMLTRGTHRSVSAQVRKSLILRFLGKCHFDEILWFLRMAFGEYAKFGEQTMEITMIGKLIQKNFNLNAICSPKKLKSIVNLIEIIRKEFGGLINIELHEFMLKLLIFVGSYCQNVLDIVTMEEYKYCIHGKIPIVYRNIKNMALLCLVNFIIHIENFDWKPIQWNCIHEIFVCPIIERLPRECIHTPTALLKLLLQWGEQPRFYTNLMQKVSINQQNIVFHYMIELLMNEHAKSPVKKPIMGLIAKLLNSSAAREDVDEENSKLALSIVKPYIPQILERLKMNFGVGLKKRKRQLRFDKQDLNILSLLTNHVIDAETCDSLLQILLPVLIQKLEQNTNDEFIITQSLITIKNLIKRLNEPEMYIIQIAPLFEIVQDVSGRKLLCELLIDIERNRLKQMKNDDNSMSSELCERLGEMKRLILMLNAWDKRWLEQPDYDKRLDAFKELNGKLENDNIDLEFGILIIYNCCHFIRYDRDIGLRDNASEHLRLLLPKLTKKYENDVKKIDYLIGDIFINMIRRLIRDPNDNVRNESLRLLGTMVRECPNSNVILNDLSPLIDKFDEEIDFFENLIHLQSHRHGRALLKFCNHAETLRIDAPPAVRTITEFILPLATRYLLQDKYDNKHTLIDAAIEAVGIACQLLPWQHYHTILRYYLQRMRRSYDHQKQCVRIVVRILDAFHFDLTNVSGSSSAMEATKNIDKSVEIQNNENVTHTTITTTIESNENDEEELEDNLEEALEIANDEEEIAENDCITSSSNNDYILKKSIQLSNSASKRVLNTITCNLIPALSRAITERSQYDTKHKLNRKRVGYEREEEEILRVPIALALVKLMQKLPKELLDNGVPGVFMKVCTFLRSPLKSVRMLTRDILKKIISTLGSNYLPLLVDHLQILLTRGFQVHVLSVTIHGILDALRNKFETGDIDNCLGNLLDISLNDIFGDIAAEKEIQKIATKSPEAKPSAKSYLILHIAARNIQESCLLDLLMPFKDYLARSHSRKLILKIQDCFAKIITGLVENPHISLESLLIFIYGMISESIIDLLPGIRKRILSEKEKEKMRRARPDCYIIQPQPQRRTIGAINNRLIKSNAHILIEFGLEMLHIILKRKKLSNVDYEAFLNPILPLLRDSLKSTYIRVITFTLKCFAAIWNNEYNLTELNDVDEYLSNIVVRMFEIFKNLSTFGSTKQEDNLQLIKSILKAFVALIRHCPQYTLTIDQIDQLILHIEHDLYEGDKQPVCFALLKSMLGRKVDTPAMHDIMNEIAKLSIISQSDYVRDECRNLLLIYVIEYTLKKRIDQIIKNLSVQLCYAVPSGRLSAIKFFASIIKRFPQNILSQRAEFLYLSLGTRLVNDDDSICRKEVADCIESLISRLEKIDRSRLFEMTLLLFCGESQKPSVREMAACLCSRFLNVEKRSFKARLPEILPLIVGRLTFHDPRMPGKHVRAPTAQNIEVENEQKQKQQQQKPTAKRRKHHQKNECTNESNEQNEELYQRAIDHEIIQTQYCIHKILEHCLSDVFANGEEKLLNNVDELAYASQRLLAHDHSWVRSNASKTISQILALYDFTLVHKRLCYPDLELTGNAKWLNFIYADPANDIKSLVLDLCAQIVPGETPQPMIDEITRIFLYIANMLKNVPFAMQYHNGNPPTKNKEESKSTKINIKWLVGRIRFLINQEVAKAPHCITVRKELFNLIEGLIAIVSVDVMKEISPTILLLLVREMSEDDQQVDAELRQRALHVGSRLRKCIGSDSYDKLRAQAQRALLIRRAERRKLLAQEKVSDPVRAAKRKSSMQERKKAAKKRKNDVMRGKVADVKQKLNKQKRKRKAENDDVF